MTWGGLSVNRLRGSVIGPVAVNGVGTAPAAPDCGCAAADATAWQQMEGFRPLHDEQEGRFRTASLHPPAASEIVNITTVDCSAGFRGRHNVPSLAHSGSRQRPVASPPATGRPHAVHGRAVDDQGENAKGTPYPAGDFRSPP